MSVSQTDHTLTDLNTQVHLMDKNMLKMDQTAGDLVKVIKDQEQDIIKTSENYDTNEGGDAETGTKDVSLEENDAFEDKT